MKVINPAITLDEMAKKREKIERKKKVLAVNRLGHVFEALTSVKYVINKSDWHISLPNGSEISRCGLDDEEPADKILGKGPDLQRNRGHGHTEMVDPVS